MTRTTVALTSLLAGMLVSATTLVGSAGAQPAPPAPPTAPKGPKPPKPPKAPRPPAMPDISAQIKVEMRAALAETIAELEGNDDIPPSIKARILKSLKKAQSSGNPSDLIDLSDLNGLGADLSDKITDEVERALKQAGKDAKIRIHKGGVRIDLGGDPWAPGAHSSPFDDPDLGWLRGLPFGPFGGDVDAPDLDLDLDLDLDFDPDDVQLDPAKVTALEKIAADEDKITEPAQKKVVELGRQLKKVVAGANPNQAEIDRLVDAITAEEAKIRKARLGALTQTRKVIGK
ncbi:MAG: hypothetical protein IPL61_21455 [Myxococcales bacterium]|nr:hypothetical protein [Myxococcales bacterium]